jgi:hypothetical protein
MVLVHQLKDAATRRHLIFETFRVRDPCDYDSQSVPF